MPAHSSEETHQHESGDIHQHIAENASSKTESTASDHPMHRQPEPKGEQVKFIHHQANPGPAIPQDQLKDVPQEGTRDERRARAEALNK